ncbi:MAG: FAD binding domain-containing protein [Nitrososphaeria archaeon]|nr:FAD binding domain-containing protein [Nitrososphaeria archaeon]
MSTRYDVLRETELLFGHLRLPAFRVYRPTTVEEAVERLNSSPGSLPISGGTSLLPALRLGTAKAEELVDLSYVRDLHGFTRTADGVAVGGMTRHSDLPGALEGPAAELVRSFLRKHTSPHIASLATVGGSVGVGLSTEDLLTVGLVLDARVKLAGPDGASEVDLSSYLSSKKSYAGTVATHILFPRRPDGWVYGFEKVSLSVSKWPLVAVAFGLKVSGRVVEDCRLSAAYRSGNVQGRLLEAEAVLKGSRLDGSTIERVVEAARRDVRPEGSNFASEDYRRDVTARLLGAGLLEVLGQ